MGLEIKHVTVGPLRTNCYIIISNDESLIIDPGGDPAKIISIAKKTKVKAIVATHGHFDHVLAAPVLKEKLGSEFWIHKNDVEIMKSYMTHMYIYGIPEPDKFVEEGDIILVGDTKWRILHTPGHTPGSICILNYSNKIVFTGDTIFRGALGRTDLPSGDVNVLFDSLRKIFSLLTRDFVVYPGHGERTTLGEEYSHYSEIL